MSETITNRRMLRRAISLMNSDDFTTFAEDVGRSEGDFTAYLRNRRMVERNVNKGAVHDPVTGGYKNQIVREVGPLLPYDDWEGTSDVYRPDHEFGVETVCSFTGGRTKGGSPKFEVVAASMVEIAWKKVDSGDYAVDSSSIGSVNLDGTELTEGTQYFDPFESGIYRYNSHFLGPYCIHQLDKHLDERVGQAGVLLEGQAGDMVALNVDGNRMNGLYYPAPGDPIIAYWSGPGLRIMERWSGYRDAMPEERPFFNFDAGFNGDPMDRSGFVGFGNTTNGSGDYQRVFNNFVSIVGQLEHVDIR